MHTRLSQAVEDYLKVIYELTTSQERASTNEIAERMDVKPASVTNMVQKMAEEDPPLVEYQKHHGVLLTQEGKHLALEILRHHRLLELFLQRKLGYSWDEVHHEADQLEHYISEEFEQRIADLLGNPAYDPHGHPIPSSEFELPEQSRLRLADLRPGSQATIQCVDDQDQGMLKYLGSIGLVPTSTISVIGYSSFDGNLRLQVNDQPAVEVLGPAVTSHIYVDMLPVT